MVVSILLHIGAPPLIESVDGFFMSLLAIGLMLLLDMVFGMLSDGLLFMVERVFISLDGAFVVLIVVGMFCPAAYKASVVERTEKVVVFICG